MSILSGIVGLFQGGKASRTQQTAYQDAESLVGDAYGRSVDELGAASKTALGQTNDARDQANQTLQGGYDAQVQNLNPYLSAGQQGVQGLADYAKANPQFSWDPTTNQNDPAYQFRNKQAEESIANKASLKGLLSSGNFAKDIADYSTGSAAQYENDDFSRALSTFKTNQDSTLGVLGTLAGLGTTATGQFNQATQNSTGLQSKNTTDAGTANANRTTSVAEFLANLDQQAQQQRAQYRVGRGQAQANGYNATTASWDQIGKGVTELIDPVSKLFQPKPASA